MGVGGVNLRLDVGAIVEEDIENEVALMIIGAYVAGVDRNVVGDRRIGNNPLFQPKVFWRMAGVEGTDAGLEFLAVAAGCTTSLMS
jgi:hypothetical protein